MLRVEDHFLADLVREQVNAHYRWSPGTGVLIGLSGGPDSTALAMLLAEVRRETGIRLQAAYFDHGWRGEASIRDGDWAQRLAQQLAIPFRRGRWEQPQKDEDSARRARYTFLGREARRTGCTVVAVAHHMDDQVETVLLRLFRGAGLRGLGGMEPSAPYPVEGFPEIRVARPLLTVRRADLLAYLEQHSLHPCTDESNELVTHRRNWIRHRILPLVDTEFGAQARTAMARAAASLREDEQALSIWAERELLHCLDGDGLRLSEMAALPTAVRHRMVRSWWAMRTGCPLPSRAWTVALNEMTEGAELDVPHGFRARVRAGVLQLESVGTDMDGTVPETTLPCPGSVLVGARLSLQAAMVPWPDPALLARVHQDANLAVGDAQDAALPLRVRAPRTGERIVPFGNSEPRRVRKLATSDRVPIRALVVDACDRALWVVGVRPSDAFRVGRGTTSALLLSASWQPMSRSLC